MSSYDELMADLVDEPEEVMLATFDAYAAYAETESANEDEITDWLEEGAAQERIARIMCL